MKLSILFVAMLAAVAAFVAWHSGGVAPPPAMAAAREPGWVPQQPSRRWTCVVIHHSGQSVGGADRLERARRSDPSAEGGYHFVIGNGSDTADGQIEATPRWREQAPGAHCRTDDGYYNEHGIGICLVGNLDRHPPTAEQTKSLERVTAFLCREYRIPSDRVYLHAEIPGSPQCPGRAIDPEALRRTLRGGK